MFKAFSIREASLWSRVEIAKWSNFRFFLKGVDDRSGLQLCASDDWSSLFLYLSASLLISYSLIFSIIPHSFCQPLFPSLNQSSSLLFLFSDSLLLSIYLFLSFFKSIFLSPLFYFTLFFFLSIFLFPSLIKKEERNEGYK